MWEPGYEPYGVKQAKEWLGHSDPATTLTHYGRLTTGNCQNRRFDRENRQLSVLAVVLLPASALRSPASIFSAVSCCMFGATCQFSHAAAVEVRAD
jgi:hypothetical protein